MKYFKRDIFKPGVLSELTDNVLSGLPTSNFQRLTTDEMHRIPELYSGIDYKPSNIWYWSDEPDAPQVYGKSLLDVIDAEKVYKTTNGKEVLGRDIKAITLLMYLKPRTAYWKPSKPQIHDTSVCAAVPLPMLGFRKYRGIPYDAWRYSLVNDTPEGLPCITPDILEDGTIDLIPGDVYDDHPFFCIDLLLGKGLASTTYDLEADTIEFTKSYGLAVLSFFEDNWKPNYNDIHYFRSQNMGNHQGSFASSYGTAAIDIDLEDTSAALRAELHNKCSTTMRLMLSQRWAWYGRHRNENMIMDFTDWSYIPKNVDDMSTSFAGIKPARDKNPTTRLKERFGL